MTASPPRAPRTPSRRRRRALGPARRPTRAAPGHAWATALAIGVSGLMACKEGSSNEPPPPAPVSQGHDTRQAEAQPSKEPPPPPGQAVEALAGEDHFERLTRLSFEGHASAPRFAPDDDAIHFLHRASAEACATLAAVDREGRPLDAVSVAGPVEGFALRSGAWAAAVAPEGTECGPFLDPWYALSDRFDLVTGDETQAARALDIGPAWEGDPSWLGTSLIFSSTATGDPELWRVDPKTGARQQLTRAKGPDLGARVSPDGSFLVWTAGRPAGPAGLAAWAEFERDGSLRPMPTEIRRMDADGSGDRPLTRFGAHSFAPVIAPDGRLWFTSNLHDPQRRNFDLFRMSLARDAGPPEQVTHGPGFDGQASLSADGKAMVFVSDRDGKGPALYLAQLSQG